MLGVRHVRSVVRVHGVGHHHVLRRRRVPSWGSHWRVVDRPRIGWRRTRVHRMMVACRRTSCHVLLHGCVLFGRRSSPRTVARLLTGTASRVALFVAGSATLRSRVSRVCPVGIGTSGAALNRCRCTLMVPRVLWRHLMRVWMVHSWNWVEWVLHVRVHWWSACSCRIVLVGVVHRLNCAVMLVHHGRRSLRAVEVRSHRKLLRWVRGMLSMVGSHSSCMVRVRVHGCHHALVSRVAIVVHVMVEVRRWGSSSVRVAALPAHVLWTLRQVAWMGTRSRRVNGWYRLVDAVVGLHGFLLYLRLLIYRLLTGDDCLLSLMLYSALILHSTRLTAQSHWPTWFDIAAA